MSEHDHNPTADARKVRQQLEAIASRWLDLHGARSTREQAERELIAIDAFKALRTTLERCDARTTSHSDAAAADITLAEDIRQGISGALTRTPGAGR